jgi:two-component system, NtrC family, response regulator
MAKNIRELESCIKKAVLLVDKTKITANDLGHPSFEQKYPGMTLKEAREAIEEDMVIAALHRYKGNVTKAAEELGITRPTIYDLMVKYSIPKTNGSGRPSEHRY